MGVGEISGCPNLQMQIHHGGCETCGMPGRGLDTGAKDSCFYQKSAKKNANCPMNIEIFLSGTGLRIDGIFLHRQHFGTQWGNCILSMPNLIKSLPKTEDTVSEILG